MRRIETRPLTSVPYAADDVLEALPQGILIADPQQQILHANAAFVAITGYPRSDVIGRNLGFLHGADTDPCALLALREALTAGRCHAAELLNYRKDGTPFWNEFTISPVHDDSGRVSHLVAVTVDVTRRHEAEERQRQSEQRLQLALSGASLGLWDWFAGTGELIVNDFWLSMLGLTRDDPPPTIDSWHDLILEEDRPILERLITEVILNPTGHEFEAVVRARHRDGRILWILDKGAVVERDLGGRPVRVVGTHLDISESYRVRTLLESTTAMLERTSAMAQVGGWEFDILTRQVRWSQEIFRILEYPGTVAPTPERILEFYQGEARVTIHNALRAATVHGTSFDVELPVVTALGNRRWVRAQGAAAIEDGTTRKLLGAFHDITERREAEQRQRETDQLLRNLANRVPGVIYQFQLFPDGRSRFPWASGGMWDIYELTADEVREDATRVFSRLHPGDVEAVSAAILLSAETLQPWQQEYRVVLPQQGERWRQGSAMPERLPDGSTLWHGFIADSTERKEAEAHTRHLADYDALTDLPNRRLLSERMREALSAAMDQGWFGALLFIDLDNFKQINDARGHALGDAILKELARRLEPLGGADDTVARLGGDEFVLLANRLGADGLAAQLGAQASAERVRQAFEAPFVFAEAAYTIRASIGITLFPKGKEHTEDLLSEADTAMYRAKAAGRNRVAFFEATMKQEVEERLALEQELNVAIARGQIEVHVQPQFDRCGEAIGGELLLRWRHPQRGYIPPVNFIPIAEQTGTIFALGELVLRAACQALQRLQGRDAGLSLSINVSPHQFRRDDFVERVRLILAETGAPAASLIFEMTEGVLIEDWKDTSQRMAELVALGVRFSIDDFGTGYSSLAYLKKLPLYELKIDKSFVQEVPHDGSVRAIVESILSMARPLGLRVVAEGVETEEQAQFLIHGGCDALQGYLFAYPRPLAHWLEDLAP